MGAGDMADCAFMYVSFLLALCYLSLLAFVVRYLSRLFRREDKRRAQKFFLALVVLQCLGRVTYFLVWPLVGDTCDPTLTSNSFSLLDVAGTMPPAFFISAFSVLVFTFARIYHCILRHNTAQQQRLFRALAVFLVGMNVCVYAGTIVQYISSAGSGFIPDDLEAYLLSVVCFVVALLFLLYGTLLYIECQKVIREASATPQQSHGIPGPKFSSASAASASNPYQPHHPSSHSRGTMAQDVASAMGRSTGLAPPQTPSPPGSDAPTVQPNPMRKIAIIAAICTLCLTVRTILIPLVDFLGGSFSWPVLLVYLFFAEILPLILMLKVFDTSAASQPARAAGNGLDAPLLGDGAAYDDNNADRRHPDGRPAGASEADVNVSVTPTQSPRPAFGARHQSPQRSAPPNSLAAAHPVVPAMQSPPLYPQTPQPLSAAHQQRLHQQHLLAAGGMAFATNASGTGGGSSNGADLLYGALPPALLAFRDTSPAATVRPPSAAGSAAGANSDPSSRSDVEVSYAY